MSKILKISVGIQPAINTFIKSYKDNHYSKYAYDFDDYGYSEDFWNSYYSRNDFDDDFEDRWGDNYANNSQSIYYYEDIDTKTKGGISECDARFTTAKSLFEYCEKKGISISNATKRHIENNYIVHCCINPEKRIHGKLELVADISFGSLFWMYSTIQDF